MNAAARDIPVRVTCNALYGWAILQVEFPGGSQEMYCGVSRPAWQQLIADISSS
jgi:hypothetical protein